jgi:mannitol-specific phosphotransferase system IIBC component
MEVKEGSAFITTMAYVAVITAVITAAVSTTAAYQQSESAQDMADYNAEVEDMKAKDAANAGANAAGDARAKARKIIAAQVEAGGMSGVDTNYGTPMGLLVETAGIGEMEALTVMNNAQRQAWGHQAQSSLDTLKSKQEKQAGALNTFGTALSGATSAYGNYKLWQ